MMSSNWIGAGRPWTTTEYWSSSCAARAATDLAGATTFWSITTWVTSRGLTPSCAMRAGSSQIRML